MKYGITKKVHACLIKRGLAKERRMFNWGRRKDFPMTIEKIELAGIN
jgi:hypothetical protein